MTCFCVFLIFFQFKTYSTFKGNISVNLINGKPLEYSSTLDRVRFALSFTKSNGRFRMHST